MGPIVNSLLANAPGFSGNSKRYSRSFSIPGDLPPTM